LALAISVTPMRPAAPALKSVMIVLPSDWETLSLNERAMMSFRPPAGQGTRNLTGRVGQSVWAQVDTEATHRRIASSKREIFMPNPQAKVRPHARRRVVPPSTPARSCDSVRRNARGNAMIRTSRRHVLMLAVLMSAAALPAAAQPAVFPTKPIRLIVPHAPGGNSDTFGRILAQKLSEKIGQQVVVENRAGAGGTVGSALVSKAAPDGYTLVVADNGTHAIAPTLYGAKLPYDVFKDFTPITLAATFPTVIMIHPSVPAQNATEFVALAKSQPGKLTYSSAGTGNGSHLTIELFRTAAGGLDMLHVPYKGGAPAVQALLAGEVQMTSVSVNTALPHITSGKVRALGVASMKRSPALPDVPTFAESGIPFDGDSWLAIMGPPGIPADVATTLNREIAATLREPETQERLAKIGLVVVASSQSGLTDVLQRDVPKWGKAVKDSGAVSD